MSWPQWLPWALFVIAVVCGVAAWWGASTRTRRGNLRRLRVSQVGEHQAEGLLTDLGLQVVERQVTRRWTLFVEGEPTEVHCRADLLVQAERGSSWPVGNVYVAEVKTGERAPDPSLPATRRQLLEYRLVFEVDGVLLVDAVAGTVVEVEFGLDF